MAQWVRSPISNGRNVRGPDVLKRMASRYRAAFPDLRITVDDVIAADDIGLRLSFRVAGGGRSALPGGNPDGPRRCGPSGITTRWSRSSERSSRPGPSGPA